jgi:hypothetical protein
MIPDPLFYRGLRYGLTASALMWALLGAVLYYVV